MMQLPDTVTKAIKDIEAAGFTAYLVGGCLRDMIMGRPVHDWDIASSARPDDVKRVFPGARVIETGARHGSLTLIVSGQPLEVTSFRRDGNYLDHRHPAQVQYVRTIEEDLARRDFTVNALAYNPSTGYIDPFGGRMDINNKVIRCVGDPDARLKEDALRIMRALRFAAVLGFTLEAGLSTSLHGNKGLLRAVSAERLSAELVRLLVGEHVFGVLMDYADVLGVLIPEIDQTVGFDQKSRFHQYDVWEHTARAVAAAKPDPVIRLALLLHDLGKPAKFFLDDSGRGHFYGHDILGMEIAQKRLKELRFPNSMIEDVSGAIRYHQIKLKEENTRKWLSRLGEDMLRLIIEVCRGDMIAHSDEVKEEILGNLHASERKLDELIAEQQCFKLSDLAINGTDLMGIGIQEGKEIGRVLAYLLQEVVEGSVENTPEDLLNAAEKYPGT